MQASPAIVMGKKFLGRSPIKDAPKYLDVTLKLRYTVYKLLTGPNQMFMVQVTEKHTCRTVYF